VVEHRYQLLVHAALAEQRLDLGRAVEVGATTPAKLFGLYPHKGTIEVGSDADLVVLDPAASTTISAATHHMNVDYSCFEGMELTGRFETVMARGRVIVDGDAFTGSIGAGRYLRRGLNQCLR
jgi:dihydropyrimidinase